MRIQLYICLFGRAFVQTFLIFAKANKVPKAKRQLCTQRQSPTKLFRRQHRPHMNIFCYRSFFIRYPVANMSYGFSIARLRKHIVPPQIVDEMFVMLPA